MTSSVLINVRLPQEMRSRFADLCEQQGISVSEAVRRMVEHAVALKTVNPDDNIWDSIGPDSKTGLPCWRNSPRICLKKITKTKNLGTFAPKTNGRSVRFSDVFRFPFGH